MIKLTTLLGTSFFVNPELIRCLESAPDTILCFIDGTRVPVRESPEEISEKIIFLKKQILSPVGRDL